MKSELFFLIVNLTVCLAIPPPPGSGGSRTEYLGGPKVGVVSFNKSGQTFESKKYYLIAKAM